MDNRDRHTELMYSETATHGLSSWHYLRAAMSPQSPVGENGEWAIPATLARVVLDAGKAWNLHDHLAVTWNALTHEDRLI